MRGWEVRVASVLLVEDDNSCRHLFSIILADAGHEVVSVAEAEEALAELRQRSFDMVLTDVRLPGMDGVELAEHVRLGIDIDPTPVVLFSVGERPEGVPDSWPFYRKPLSPDDLEQIVTQECQVASSLEGRVLNLTRAGRGTRSTARS